MKNINSKINVTEMSCKTSIPYDYRNKMDDNEQNNRNKAFSYKINQSKLDICDSIKGNENLKEFLRKKMMNAT